MFYRNVFNTKYEFLSKLITPYMLIASAIFGIILEYGVPRAEVAVAYLIMMPIIMSAVTAIASVEDIIGYTVGVSLIKAPIIGVMSFFIGVIHAAVVYHILTIIWSILWDSGIITKAVIDHCKKTSFQGVCDVHNNRKGILVFVAGVFIKVMAVKFVEHGFGVSGFIIHIISFIALIQAIFSLFFVLNAELDADALFKEWS